MDHMEFSIALPPLVELTNAGVEWNTMKQRLYTHLNPGSISSSNPHRNYGLRRPFLISIASEQVQGIFNMYDVSYSEAAKFSKILQNIEDLCLPRFLIIYNRFRFFTCKQNGPEFNGFLQQLLAWSDLCEFGDLKDILLKDCIISGISDESVRQHLLRTEQLDFDKTVEICRAGLAKKQMVDDFKPPKKTFVDVSTDTILNFEFIEDAEIEKLNVGTNTFLEVSEKAVQTFSIECDSQEIGEDDDVVPITITDSNNFERSHFRNNNQRESCDAHPLSDSFLYHEGEPMPQLGIDSNCVTNKEGSSILQECGTENIDFGNNCQEFKMPLPLLSGPYGVQESHQVSLPEDQNMNSAVRVINNNSEYVNNGPGQIGMSSLNESNNDDNISVHIQSSANAHRKVANLKCRACKMPFKDLQSLHKHKKTHEVEKRHKCELCPARFYNASHLKVHKRLHTGERPFACNICGESYVEASKLKAHMRKHTGERPYACNLCPMTFTWSAAYKRHKRIHTGERPYACEYCAGTFSDFTALKRHSRIHTDSKLYKCDVCGRTFRNPLDLRTHRRIHTEERPYRCKYCRATFTRSSNLKEHVKLHLGEKAHKCETCGAAFIDASKLRSHTRRHTGEKPYQCNICGMSFAWTSAFNRHMRTHTAEKLYKCKICSCSFADSNTLIRHHHTHTGERPFHCNLCGSRFAEKSSLYRHQQIHSGEKAFTCEICGASFAVKSYLNRHIRIHTGEKPYSCDKCDSKFIDASKLKRHQKIHERARLKRQQEQQQQDEQNLSVQHPEAIGHHQHLTYPAQSQSLQLQHGYHNGEILSDLSTRPAPSYMEQTSESDLQFGPTSKMSLQLDPTDKLGLQFDQPSEQCLQFDPLRKPSRMDLQFNPTSKPGLQFNPISKNSLQFDPTNKTSIQFDPPGKPGLQFISSDGHKPVQAHVHNHNHNLLLQNQGPFHSHNSARHHHHYRHRDHHLHHKHHQNIDMPGREIIHGHEDDNNMGNVISLHRQDADAEVGLAHLSMAQAQHQESLDLASSVSASLGMAPGMESLASILAFDS